MTAYDPPFEDLVAKLDAELDRFLAAKCEFLPEARPMIDELTRMLAAGGKRFRPLFCYWGFRAARGSHNGEIVAASGALELLHTFAIVHDDIMDRSAERRGLPTTFHLHGTDVALLVGDLALVLADAALMESGFEPQRLLATFGSYSRMRQQVIAGQYLDVIATRDKEISVNEARRIAILKSGRYSIEEPLLIGASLAGASDRMLDGLRDFGAPLGEAFQLRDDLLGTFGDPDRTGKPVDSDIREGKRHVPYALALETLSGDERDAFIARWGAGDRLDADDVATLRDLLVSSGARKATEDLVDGLRNQAQDALDRLELDDQSHAALAELASRATDRAL